MVKPAVLAEARTLTDSDSGKTYFLNLAAGFTITLPSPRGGINFKFIVKTAPTGNYVITTKASSAIIRGQVITNDQNTGHDPNFETSGVSNVKLLANLSKVGDSVELESDGTYWYATGFCSIWEAVSFLEQSKSPSVSLSRSPSVSPSVSLSRSPSRSPSVSLSRSPSASPSVSLSRSPSISPSVST